MEMSDVLSEFFTLNNLNDFARSFISPTHSNGYLLKDFGKELKIPNFTSRVSDFIFLTMSSKGSSVQNSVVLMVICKVSGRNILIGNVMLHRSTVPLFCNYATFTHRGYGVYCAMFTGAEASHIRREFWTTFGKYMRPVLSAEGVKINWLNYHTGVKNIYFRMDANQHRATISISIQHPDPDVEELYFDQFVELKGLLHTELQEAWEWQLRLPADDGKVATRIYKELPGVSVLNRNQWPELISFFKKRIIALDKFWETARYTFQV